MCVATLRCESSVEGGGKEKTSDDEKRRRRRRSERRKRRAEQTEEEEEPSTDKRKGTDHEGTQNSDGASPQSSRGKNRCDEGSSADPLKMKNSVRVRHRRDQSANGEEKNEEKNDEGIPKNITRKQKKTRR